MFNDLIGSYIAHAPDDELIKLVDTYASVEFIRHHPEQILLLLNEFRNRLEPIEELRQKGFL